MTDTEAQAWAWGWYDHGGRKHVYPYLPTVFNPNLADGDGPIFPLYAHPPADTLARLQRERDQAVELVKQAVAIFTYCTVEDGVCCCGDYMDKHSNPMSCGHSPVDHGSYVAGRWREDALATLASIEGAEQ